MVSKRNCVMENCSRLIRLKSFAMYRRNSEYTMKSPEQVIAADHDRAENAFRHVRRDAENIGQIAVHFIDQPVVIPGLPRPEPLPAGPSNKVPMMIIATHKMMKPNKNVPIENLRCFQV
jgi:hypothetical protein